MNTPPGILIDVQGDPGAYATDRGTAWQAAVRSSVQNSDLKPFTAGARLGIELVIRQVVRRPSDQTDLDNVVKHTIDALEGVLGTRQQGGRPQADDGRIDVIHARREWVSLPEGGGATVRVWRLDDQGLGRESSSGSDPVIVLAGKQAITLAQAEETIDSYPLTTLRIYDGPGSSDEPRFTPADVGRLIVIEPINRHVAVRLLEADLDWSLLPPGVSLVSADPENSVYANAAKLFAEVDALAGVGPAIASKVLHLKRPHFFPLLDSVLRILYREAAAHAYQASAVWQKRQPTWRHLYWAAVRADVLNAQNQAALAELRRRLRVDVKNERRQRAAALSDVRVLDILAWGGAGSVESPGDRPVIAGG